MARIRNIKPDFWLDRKLARKLSRDERMLYMGMWNQADEWARMLGDPNVVKGCVFPYDDDLPVPVIARMLDRLVSTGVVQRYFVDEDPYLFLPNLHRHQRLEPGKTPSKLPEPPPVEAPGPGDIREGPAPEREHSENAEDCSEKIPEQSAGDPEDSALLYCSSSLSFSSSLSSSSEIPPMKEEAGEDPDPPREDVEALCIRLRDRIQANGSKATISAKWRTEARLLLDNDGRDPDKALRLIDWCQSDPFWQANILSMRTFRAKYDQLRLRAIEAHGRASPNGPGPSRSDQKVQAFLNLAVPRTELKGLEP